MLRKLLLTLFFGLAAALLVALGYWNIAPENDKVANTGADTAIDFYAVNARTVQYQADGKLHYEMTGTKIEHLKASDVSLVSQPDLQLYRGTPLPWHVRSERAEVSPNGQEVELIDAVRVERTDAKGRPTIITTSRMTVFPDKEYAQTQQAVRIEAANGVTTANGMKAYLKDSRVLLLSNVRGQHEVR
ncbi:LPS export ABC transporter periplasmic protein LptC [Pseudomonas cavernae]|uniref:Lipopolysaccharide export system protein LptC n=1 Tax=Pseudomonas cavernae TaxID=2320867 RepID=A0A385Z968_9PSED|nr:LPS export ABC transporter periplasmic protein LptC [Pseudomonas cavernae]AYC34238.1 LPS export ABC transporter periplasmic protein LptC [Pseudomonas cavernae]